MEQAEIIEGNRMIAEFLGWKYEVTNEQLDAYFNGERMWCDRPQALQGVLINGFKFHSSWDKLMPVVEKIGNIRIVPYKIIRFEIVNGYTKIEGTGRYIFYNSSIEGSKLLATYKAVIDFIKWYNSQPSNQ